MRTHSRYESLEAMLNDNEIHIKTVEEFKAIDEVVLDNIIHKCTDFANWREFMSIAANSWIKKKVGI